MHTGAFESSAPRKRKGESEMKSTLTFVLMAMTAAPVVGYRIDRHFLASMQ